MTINRVILSIYLVLVVLEVALLLTQHYGRADQLASVIFVCTFGIGIWKIFTE